MTMIIIYTFDGEKIYAGAVDVDPMGPVPPGTLDAPPDTVGDEVAQWIGSAWVVLPQRPVAPPVQESAPPTRTRFDVLADLATLDTKSIRALRESNATRIAELEAQAIALRAELAAL